MGWGFYVRNLGFERTFQYCFYIYRTKFTISPWFSTRVFYSYTAAMRNNTY